MGGKFPLMPRGQSPAAMLGLSLCLFYGKLPLGVFLAAQLCALKAELTHQIDSQKDSLRFYRLGNAYHDKVEHIGVQGGYRPDDVLML